MIFLFSCLCVSRFALLVCGSRSWENYRQQSNIYGLYQRLLKRGYQNNEIWVVSFDDAVYHPLNPYPGKMFINQEHENVYPGLNRMKFRGDGINADSLINFMLTIPTTKDDEILIYITAHGGPHFISAPSGGRALFSNEIAEVFSSLSSRGAFKKCIFVVESCNSGSIGESIKAPNVLVITSSSPTQVSYSDITDPILGIPIADQLSSSFYYLLNIINDMKVSDFVQNLRGLTRSSDISIYGDLSIMEMPMSRFFGNTGSNIEFQPVFDADPQYSFQSINQTQFDNILNKLIGCSGLEYIKGNYLESYKYIVDYLFKHGMIKTEEMYKLDKIFSICKNYSMNSIIRCIEKSDNL